MRTIGIISQKGGVGKTTLATCLAVEAARDGKRVILIDLDPQATAAFWGDMRGGDDIAVMSIQVARLAQTLKAAAEAGADLAIIDGAAVSRDIAHEAAAACDYVVIPFRAAVFDLNAVAQTIAIVKGAKRPFGLVMTFVPPQGRETREAEEVARELGAALLPVRIGQRKAYFRAQALGKAVQELPDDPKAAAEIRELYMQACQHAGISTSEKGADRERKRA
jgi:chromosome partitioning protein